MRDTGECHQKILQLCRDVIKYSVKTSRNGILSTVALHADLNVIMFTKLCHLSGNWEAECFSAAYTSMQTAALLDPGHHRFH